MSTTRTHLRVRNIDIEVHYKEIKNLHLAVYPPEGRVRVAAPMYMDDDQVRLAVIQRLTWIRRHQRDFQDAPRQTQREMVTGESHYLWGVRYRLKVVETTGKPAISISGRRITLQVRPETAADARREVLAEWYRALLHERLSTLIAKWEPIVGKTANHWGIRKMKTKWGSCNATSGRLLFNLDLAQKPLTTVEYVVVHELIHLLERSHSDRFRQLLEQHLPTWKKLQSDLNQSPLNSERWID